MTLTAAPWELDAVRMATELVDALDSKGVLHPDWRSAFRAVPRHLFVPDVIWLDSKDDDTVHPLHRDEQPSEWLTRVYADEPVVIQVNDGATAIGSAGHVSYTSSTSMPTVVAKMLTALRADSGMRVLEIGTGTGWNTALLAHRLGGNNITSMEIDPAISAHARSALEAAGFSAVAVITGDGTLGRPDRAPYDRVLSTAAVYRVPHAWIAQTRPGGLVVTPWATDYLNGHLLALTVSGDGTATGRIVGQTAFMTVRDQRVPPIRISDIVTDDSEAQANEQTSNRHPRWYVADYDTRTAIGVQVDYCRMRYTGPDSDDADGILWFLDPWSGSWAAVHHRPSRPGPFRVRQYGPRRLFDEVSTAYQIWKHAGKPPASRWRITVTPHGQDTELPTDTPSRDQPRHRVQPVTPARPDRTGRSAGTTAPPP